MMTQRSSTWDSSVMIFFRWLFYVPVGLIILKLTEVAGILFLAWLFRDTRGFLLYGFLFGGLVFVFAALGIFHLGVKFVAHMCPSKRVGMIVFGTIFILVELINLIGFYSSDYSSGLKLLSTISAICCGMIVLANVVDIYKSSIPVVAH